MKLLIFTYHSFPKGLAQTNRLIALSRGLKDAGCNTKIYVLKPTEDAYNIRNKSAFGEYLGIPFKYLSKTTVKNKNSFFRIINSLKGIVNSLITIIKENKKEKVDVLYCSSRTFLLTSLMFLICKTLRIKLVHERSEYPFLSYSNSIVGRLKLQIYLNFVCRLFDGFIVISKALKGYYEKYTAKRTKFYLLPILVEPDRFKNDNPNPDNNLVYCGSMQGEKDGVPILIDSFSKIVKNHSDVKLLLIGDINFEGFELLTRKIDCLNLNDKVIFTGRIERDDMPQYLNNSIALVLARPANKQAEGGFPTKLGEYLATGRPVLVTDVGEISEYLIHNENAFIAEPGNPDDFAEKLEFILNNKKVSSEVGQKGRELAYNEFNYKVQGRKLLNWLETEI